MMSTLEERVTALEAKVEQLHLFDQMTSRIVEVIQQTGREAMHATADLGEQFDHMEADVAEIKREIASLKIKVDTGFADLNGKFDAHMLLLQRLLKRLGDEE